jgi:hypothetical protein
MSPLGRRIMTRLWLVAGLVGSLTVPAFAQAPAGTPTRITGTVQTATAQQLVVATADGHTASIALPAQITVTALVNRTLADIKPGDFVGSAAIKGMDGKLHAQEVHIFPEAMRGTGEGHRPMDKPDQTMTNATVGEVATATDGQTLTLTYAGGQQQIDVGPDARIVAFVPGDRGLLKPGAAVAVSALKAPDGSLTARSIQAEKDGVKPLVF